MNLAKITSLFLSTTFVAGCASNYSPYGAQGPGLVASGRMTESGQYAEVGMEFTTWGDFVALVSPNRWKSPIATGGSLSWVNPVAWSEDPGRTGRIFLGEAVVAGGAVAAVSVSDGSSGGSGSGINGGTTDSGTATPHPPPGSGGDVPPPPEI